MESGLLYVVFNKWIRNPETDEMPYKIGITKNSVYDRYYGLGLKMPGRFETLFAYRFEDCVKAEQLILGILNKKRENGEWFNIGKNELDLIKSNCELMEGKLVTDEVESEIKTETQTGIESENFENKNGMKSSKIVQRNIFRSEKPINPNHPCKIFLLPIHRAIAKGESPYEATQKAWRVAERYRDVSEYEFVAGLKGGISLTAYKIKKWICLPQSNKCKFEKDGEEISEFKEFTWHKQINAAKGYYGYGNHLMVEFDGKGKFKLIRPDKEQWMDCL
jgi:hypothetical protein